MAAQQGQQDQQQEQQQQQVRIVQLTQTVRAYEERYGPITAAVSAGAPAGINRPTIAPRGGSGAYGSGAAAEATLRQQVALLQGELEAARQQASEGALAAAAGELA